MAETNHGTEQPLVASAAMLIRRPVDEVFEAIVNPEITTKFWFTKSSGKLEPGARVRWDWEMYGVGTEVDVVSIEPRERIVIEWGVEASPRTVEWRFDARPDGTTYLRVTESGFIGSAREVAEQAIDSTGGFTVMVAGLKTYLEHGIELNLVGDVHPTEHVAT